MNTNTKSQVAELKVAADLAKRGYLVSIPVASAPYDLIVDRNGRLERIQVKHADLHEGVVQAKLERTRVVREGVIRKTYSQDEIDWFAIYVASTDAVYYVPIEEAEDKTAISLRVTPAKNHQKRNINFAGLYIDI